MNKTQRDYARGKHYEAFAAKRGLAFDDWDTLSLYLNLVDLSTARHIHAALLRGSRRKK